MAKLHAFHALLVCLPVVSQSLVLKLDAADIAWGDRPVTKVVHLLQDMQAQIQKEGEDDEAMFDKLACWCETNDKSKTKAIAASNQQITQLKANIQEYSARVAQLDSDTKELDKDNAAKLESLNTAQALRAKEQEEFQSHETDLVTSINSLHNAAGVVGKEKTNLAQVSLVDMHRTLRDHLEVFKHMFEHGSFPPNQNPMMSFLQKSDAITSAPNYGSISGILKSMKQTFEANLANARSDEEQAKSQYEAMRSTKQAEMQASQNQHEEKMAEYADAIKKLARSKVALVDVRAALKADSATLRNLKVTCQKVDQEWQERQTARNAELQAISETIAILTDDESKEVMDKATSFVQFSLRTPTTRRHAAAMLEELRGHLLVQTAASVRSAPFDKVVDSVESLVDGLKSTQKDEASKREWCITEIKDNQRKMQEKTSDKEDIQQRLDQFANTGEQLAEQITALKAEVLDIQVQMKQAGFNREKENSDFQTTLMDQRATQRILTKAVARLQEFYGLLQVKQAASSLHTSSMPPLKKNQGSSGAIALLETIIQDSNKIELDVLAAEKEAQAAYEAFMKNSHQNVKVAQESLATATQEKGKLDGAQATAKGELSYVSDELSTIEDYQRRLQSQCDYLTKNFEELQGSREDEIEALKSARSTFENM